MNQTEYEHWHLHILPFISCIFCSFSADSSSEKKKKGSRSELIGIRKQVDNAAKRRFGGFNISDEMCVRVYCLMPMNDDEILLLERDK